MGKKILVVDDEADLLKMVDLRLTAGGYQVVTAQNGIEGLKKAEEENPDLIISDVMMPEMDGFAFYKELRSQEATKDIPVLILTARDKMKATFMAMGADGFISKPFSQEELLNKVSSKMGQAMPYQAAPQKHENEDISQEEQSVANVFIAGCSQAVIEKMESILREKNCKVKIVTDAQQVIGKADTFKPDFIALEVLMNGEDSKDIVAGLRKSKNCRNIPIILYSYLDKENSGEESLNRKRADIDSSKTSCVTAGATESIGYFDEPNFIKTIERFLPAR